MCFLLGLIRGTKTKPKGAVMESDWEKAIEFVLKMEGGHVNDPNDPGGETKYGISKKAYPNVDITNLTLDEAKKIYKRDYWDQCHCDELPTGFAISIMDMAVNMGTGKAKRLLQTVLEVGVDGIIGPITVSAAHKARDWRVKKFLAGRLVEYTRIINKNPNLMVFANNWSYRVVSLTVLLYGGNDGRA